MSAQRRRRILALVIGLGVIGGTVAVTQASNAATLFGKKSAACAEDGQAAGNGDRRKRRFKGNLAPEAVNPAIDDVAGQAAPGAADAEAPAVDPEAAAAAGDPAAGEAAAAEGAEGNGEAAAAEGAEGNGEAAAAEEQAAPENLAEAPPVQANRRQGNNNNNCEQPAAAPPAAAPANLQDSDTLGDSCENLNGNGSQLEQHNGLQEGPRCVATEFGEVAAEDKNPTLLIRSASVGQNGRSTFQVSLRDFTDGKMFINVSTRNLKRDRFLAAAAGGYYREPAALNAEEVTRGHIHTACQYLDDTRNAPQSAPKPIFFKATEDNQGGLGTSNVSVQVVPDATQGIKRGLLRCESWGGDGSHRIPMMQRANQAPAFDVVRIRVV